MAAAFLSSVFLASCASHESREPDSGHTTKSKSSGAETAKDQRTTQINIEVPERCSAGSNVCQNYLYNGFFPQMEKDISLIEIPKDIKFKGVKIPKGSYSLRAAYDLLQPLFKLYLKQCGIKNSDPAFVSSDASSFSKIYHPCFVNEFAKDFEKVTYVQDVQINGFYHTNLAGLVQTVGAIGYLYYSTVAPQVYAPEDPVATLQYFPSTQAGIVWSEPVNSFFGLRGMDGETPTESVPVTGQVAYNPYNWVNGAVFNFSYAEPSKDDKKAKIVELEAVDQK